MKPTLFKPEIKMVDVLHNNYHFLQMLDRFDIKFGFGDQTVEEICRERHINLRLFILVANIYNYKEYEPKDGDIRGCPPAELVAYLRKSHAYYLGYRLPYLEEKLRDLISTWESVPAKVVWSFFSEYEKEVRIHLAYEDDVVFPYVEKLIRKEKSSDYSILEFEEKHDDIEAKVKDLRNILIKYIPERNDAMKRNEFLLQLFLLEEDLNKHLQVENKVLIPVASLLEKADK